MAATRIGEMAAASGSLWNAKGRLQGLLQGLVADGFDRTVEAIGDALAAIDDANIVIGDAVTAYDEESGS